MTSARVLGVGNITFSLLILKSCIAFQGSDEMDLAKYPHAGWWLDSIQRNEAGMIIILLIALAVVGLLIDMRWIWPKLMPYLRIAVVGVFYLSFIVFLIAGKP